MGATPWKRPGPAKVAEMRQRAAAYSPVATSSSTSKRQSGKAANRLLNQARMPAGASRSPIPYMWSIEPGFQTASARSRSWSARPSKYSRTIVLAPFFRGVLVFVSASVAIV